MPRTSNQIAADFVKGRIGEEIVNQLFSGIGYEVLPIGVEHTNLKTLYKCDNVDFLFMHSRRMPDYCLVKNGTYRYVEVKFRFKTRDDPNTAKDVLKTIFYTYYHKKKMERPEPPTQYTTEYGPFKDVLMLWLFRDAPCLLRVEDIAKIINKYGTENDWLIPKMVAFLKNSIQIEWNKSGLFSDTETKNKIQKNDWNQFVENYEVIMKEVFG